METDTFIFCLILPFGLDRLINELSLHHLKYQVYNLITNNVVFVFLEYLYRINMWKHTFTSRHSYSKLKNVVRSWINLFFKIFGHKHFYFAQTRIIFRQEQIYQSMLSVYQVSTSKEEKRVCLKICAVKWISFEMPILK